jgi:hypothetical protein
MARKTINQISKRLEKILGSPYGGDGELGAILTQLLDEADAFRKIESSLRRAKYSKRETTCDGMADLIISLEDEVNKIVPFYGGTRI